ncbi:MAG: ASKHA domain-containing protein [Thermoleophilia bacterium]
MSENKTHTVIFQPSGSRGKVEEGKSILQASRELGVEIEGICGEKRTCGKCKVRIEEGFFERYGVESSTGHVSDWRPVEAKFFSDERREQGFRLACVAKIQGDLVVFVPEEARAGGQVVRKGVTDRKINVNPSVKTYYIEMIPPTLHDPLGDYERICDALKAQHGLEAPILDYKVLVGMPDILRAAGWKVSVSIWTGGPAPEIVRVAPGTVNRSIGLAVDVGTTSVAAYLCDLATGEVINYDSMMNPQVPYGEDVMSRITYAMSHDDGIHKLQDAIIEGVNVLAARVAEAVGFTHEDILELAIVFNTAMHHCFLGIYPEHLGLAPYAPALHHSINIKARDLGLKFAPGANVFVMPNEAGFVGADNVGVLIAEEPYNKHDRQLIIDIGTNGELIMGNSEKLISSSCATGPALEGAHIKFGMRAAPGAIEKIYINPETKEPRYKVIGKDEWSDEMDPETIGTKGICGSGIIDGVAELFKAGIIDKTGKFNKEQNHPRVRKGDDGDEFVLAWANETSIGRDVSMTIKDVRAVQLAKGAMYAGAKIMMQKLGYETLDRVVLAGAFGSFIDREESLVIGLFPDVPVTKAYAVGNAAGDGARMALLDSNKRAEADEWARKVEYIELSVEPAFEKEFMYAMHLPHMKDSFPNLKAVLTEEGLGDLIKG